ncbi:MAG TPA: monovalent cation/H+ antiporter subunit D [Polyangiaceae bacterium]
MTQTLAHLVVVPIVLPLVAAALLVLLRRKRRRIQSLINVCATLAGLLVAAEMLRRIDAHGGAAGVYLASNWEAPFGIVLVADRLSALMLVLVSVVSFCAALYAEAGWARVGVYFHPLFQIQLMGLNGAFLTGDLFNLFVFFEVMLAASYGLQLHGSGWPRVKSGLHYIAVNLLASSLFLVGLALLYGVTGTLSMAHMASRLAFVPATDRGLLHTGAAILAVAFLIKAAIWPMNAWLVPAYTAASAPVAALFALMTKVGIYVFVRLWTLFFSDASPSAHFGAPVLLCGGLATIAFGTVGLMSSMRLDRIAGFSVAVSSGTLLAALSMGVPSVTAAALFYLLSATLAVSALFLLVELVDRVASDDQSPPDVDVEADDDTNLDDDEVPLVGKAFPVSIALLGLAFTSCALLVAGLPPLSGFVAKLSLLSSVLSADQSGQANAGAPISGAWWFVGLLLFAGFVATVSFSRTGIRHFWATNWGVLPSIKVVEAFAVLALLCSCVVLTVWAEPVLRYTRATASELHAPKAYIEAVMSMKPRPGPTRSSVEREAIP